MQLAYPFRIAKGRAETTSEDKHLRQMIEQVLFTSQGERVNRPDFGCGLQSAIFQSSQPELLTALRFLVQGSLQRWLGDLIRVEAVEVSTEDAKLFVRVQYARHGSQLRFISDFTR